jgi:hypothetical protein
MQIKYIVAIPFILFFSLLIFNYNQIMNETKEEKISRENRLSYVNEHSGLKIENTLNP